MNEKDLVVEFKMDYKKSWENALSEIFKLQTKIDKAIEYTKKIREKYFREGVWGSNEDLSTLIEILKGVSNE